MVDYCRTKMNIIDTMMKNNIEITILSNVMYDISSVTIYIKVLGRLLFKADFVSELLLNFAKDPPLLTELGLKKSVLTPPLSIELL